MMERGQLLLVDGRPAEFLEYQSDIDGDYITYHSLRDPEGVEHWLSSNAAAVRMRHVPAYRS
jgi:hypothetical protein